MATKTFCDGCETEILTSNKIAHSIEVSHGTEDEQGKQKWTFAPKNLDFCDKCYGKIMETIELVRSGKA